MIRSARLRNWQAGRALGQADLAFPAHHLSHGFPAFRLSDQSAHFAPSQAANLFGWEMDRGQSRLHLFAAFEIPDPQN